MSNKCRKCGGQIENPDGKNQVCGECGSMKDKLREELFKILSGEPYEQTYKKDKFSAKFFNFVIDNKILPAMQKFMPDVEEIWKFLAETHGCNLSERECTFAKCYSWSNCKRLAEAIAKRLEVVPEQAEKEAND